MKPTTREILQKADLVVADLSSNGGYLNAEQANRFLDLIIDTPTIFQEIRTVRMTSPQRKVEKLGFGSRILRAAPASGETLDATDRAKPTTSKVELSTKEIIAEVHVPYDVLEDNIEHENMEASIMRHIGYRAALDLEELLVLGDTTSSDAYLALLNGLIKQTTTNTASYADVISKAAFKSAIKTMPNKYLRDRPSMRFWVSPDNETEYLDTLADRETSLGDAMVEGYRRAPAYAVPVVPAVMVPDANILFTYPKNIIWGVQRQISIETDKDIRARTHIIVLTMRIDMKYETEDAAVLIDSIVTS